MLLLRANATRVRQVRCLFVVCLMVFNATFNNISSVSWWSVLLVEETGGPEENQRPVVSHCPIPLLFYLQ